MIGAEIVLLPAELLIAAVALGEVPSKVRAVVASAEESVKLPVANVMAPVVAFSVRFGFALARVPLNVARSVAAAPGITELFQLELVLQVVLLFEVQVAF
jgi:hypothetical protein